MSGTDEAVGERSWVKEHHQVYLIGNPFVWALSTLAVLSYGAVRALLILRAQRGYKDFAHCAFPSSLLHPLEPG